MNFPFLQKIRRWIFRSMAVSSDTHKGLCKWRDLLATRIDKCITVRDSYEILDELFELRMACEKAGIGKYLYKELYAKLQRRTKAIVDSL